MKEEIISLKSRSAAVQRAKAKLMRSHPPSTPNPAVTPDQHETIESLVAPRPQLGSIYDFVCFLSLEAKPITDYGAFNTTILDPG